MAKKKAKKRIAKKKSARKVAGKVTKKKTAAKKVMSQAKSQEKIPVSEKKVAKPETLESEKFLGEKISNGGNAEQTPAEKTAAFMRVVKHHVNTSFTASFAAQVLITFDSLINPEVVNKEKIIEAIYAAVKAHLNDAAASGIVEKIKDL